MHPRTSIDHECDFDETPEGTEMNANTEMVSIGEAMGGVVAKAGSAWDARLRSMESGGAVLGHTHAVVFPYRPIRKGAIALDETVRALFETGGLQAVLHLLNDTREPEGSGDSEFLRGACWVAPVAS